MIKLIESILTENISEKDKKELIRKLFENLFEGIYNNEKLLQSLIGLTKLTIFRVFHNDRNKYQLISTELSAVLLTNNVRPTKDNNEQP
jgi:hypothetical protein